MRKSRHPQQQHRLASLSVICKQVLIEEKIMWIKGMTYNHVACTSIEHTNEDNAQ
uniref:Uncharacterized protein n=1 Tax=Rhizophora mucronata TaxID=61149 RepID=A0A2P2QU33_RHIMU